MATHDEIRESLEVFCKGYNGNEKLRVMNKDWDRVVLVKATDVNSEHTLVLKDGVVSLKDGAPSSQEMTVISDSETLADLFYGDITPTEPYMDGTLKILGTEEDVLRLDFVSLMIWGE